MEGKPPPVKGSNSTPHKIDIIAPGQPLHDVEIIFISKIPHPFSADDFCNYLNLIRMASKRKEALEQDLLILALFYRSHLKLVRCVVSDHKAVVVFLSYESLLQTHGATHRTRISGEDEFDAERGILRTFREAIRVKQLKIASGEYDLPKPFLLSLLALDCIKIRNFTTDSRSSPKIIPEGIVTGGKINFQQHSLANSYWSNSRMWLPLMERLCSSKNTGLLPLVGSLISEGPRGSIG